MEEKVATVHMFKLGWILNSLLLFQALLQLVSKATVKPLTGERYDTVRPTDLSHCSMTILVGWYFQGRSQEIHTTQIENCTYSKCMHGTL